MLVVTRGCLNCLLVCLVEFGFWLLWFVAVILVWLVVCCGGLLDFVGLAGGCFIADLYYVVLVVDACFAGWCVGLCSATLLRFVIWVYVAVLLDDADCCYGLYCDAVVLFCSLVGWVFICL